MFRLALVNFTKIIIFLDILQLIVFILNAFIALWLWWLHLLLLSFWVFLIKFIIINLIHAFAFVNSCRCGNDFRRLLFDFCLSLFKLFKNSMRLIFLLSFCTIWKYFANKFWSSFRWSLFLSVLLETLLLVIFRFWARDLFYRFRSFNVRLYLF